jgi:hypothetical protein
MNALKSMCIATILTLSLAISVAAGELNSPGYTATSPPPESNITVNQSTMKVTISNQDPAIATDVANILWLLASIF